MKQQTDLNTHRVDRAAPARKESTPGPVSHGRTVPALSPSNRRIWGTVRMELLGKETMNFQQKEE